MATYPKTARIRSSAQYRWIQRQGQKRYGQFLLLQWAQNPAKHPARLGITVSTKYGNAVSRNLLKRRLREIFRHHREQIAPGILLHLRPIGKVAHPSEVPSYSDLKQEWQMLLGRLSG